MLIKVAISPSQQAENTCIIKGCNEQKHMFVIGGYLYNLLKADGRFNPFITTKLPPMKQRDYLIKCVQETEAFDPDIRIALHSDGGYNGHGVSMFYYKSGSDGERLAKIIYKKMCNITPWNDMSCYARPELYEIRKPNCTSILLEASFHDKMNEAEWIHAQSKLIAQTIYEGILNYYGLEPVKRTLTWYQLIDTYTSNPEAWKKQINLFMYRIKEYDNYKQYKIFLFLPDLLFKIGNREVLTTYSSMDLIKKFSNSPTDWFNGLSIIDKLTDPDLTSFKYISDLIFKVGNHKK